jgi:predicted  nucleic acid-binding Zn-ribbon protein
MPNLISRPSEHRRRFLSLPCPEGKQVRLNERTWLFIADSDASVTSRSLRLAKAREARNRHEEESNRREEAYLRYREWNRQVDMMNKELERLREELDELRTDFSALHKEIACARRNIVET